MPAPAFPAWRVALGTVTLSLLAATGVSFCGLWNAGWYVQVPRDFEPAEWPCRVRMPGTVREVRIFPDADAGGREYAVLRRKPDEGFGLAAKGCDDPPGDDPVRAMAVYLGGFMTRVFGETVRPVVLTDKPYPAIQATLATRKFGNVAVRVIHGGSHLYLLIAYGTAVRPDRPDVAAFFDSLELTDDDDREEVARLLAADATRRARAEKLERARRRRETFAGQKYAGPPPLDPSTLSNLVERWRWDAAAHPRGAGVIGGAMSVRSDTVRAESRKPDLQLFYFRDSTVAFWFRTTPGDIRLVDLRVKEARLTVSLMRGELRAQVGVSEPPVVLPRPADGEWHHFAVTHRVEGPCLTREVWIDGTRAAVRRGVKRFGMEFGPLAEFGGVPEGSTDGAAATESGATLAGLDDLCIFYEAFGPAQFARLAARPAPAGSRLDWLAADPSLPKPAALFSQAAEPEAPRNTRYPRRKGVTDQISGRNFPVLPGWQECESPAGPGYAMVLPSGTKPVKPALDLTPFRGDADWSVVFWAKHRAWSPDVPVVAGRLQLLVNEFRCFLGTAGEADRDFSAGTKEPITIRRGQWNHYALTRRADGRVELYLNGERVSGHKGNGKEGDSRSQTLGFGQYREKGDLVLKFAELAVFRERLSPEQIRRIAQARVKD